MASFIEVRENMNERLLNLLDNFKAWGVREEDAVEYAEILSVSLFTKLSPAEEKRWEEVKARIDPAILARPDKFHRLV